MKNLTQHIQEKLQISRNRQYDYADDITVSNLIKLIYNYGPDFDIKDAFGRRKVKVLPTAEVNEKETEVLGKEIYKITFSGGVAWKNIPSFMTVWTWDAPQGKDSITCYEGEDEKLQSLFKPEILDEMFIFLKKHSRVQEKLQISRNKITRVEHTLFPKTTDELKKMIYSEIQKNGKECSLNHIDVSKITDMYNVFAYYEFNGDISGWDVSNVTNMYNMFAKSNFNGDISNWDVSNVTNMKEMFENADFNGDISGWDVSNVTNMEGMFSGSKFNGDLSNWDVSNVTDMTKMFQQSRFTGKNGDISNWDVSNVTKMVSMFYGSSDFTGDISKWDVSNVTEMTYMFNRNHEFNGDISKWDVSNVKDMAYMFSHSVFSQNIDNWNVSPGTNIDCMIWDCPLENNPPKWYRK